ncbi:hypothetical protein [Tenacibaculum sp. 190524A02b]|uniref:hypothetical protein n=1 Tax=Tenacibaculum vairaonense TaxID=3137860 RepID=UPI0031FA81D6
MKLKSLKHIDTLNKEELVFVNGGTSLVHSKKNDTRQDSDRSDGQGCIPPFNQ